MVEKAKELCSGAQRALVTGAAKRIGRSIALSLAQAGYDVALHCNRSRAEAEDVAAHIAAMGRRACIVVGDLSAGDKVSAIVEEAHAGIGVLDLLVNSASMFEADGVGTLRAQVWNRQFAVNAQAPIFLAQAFAAQVDPRACDPSIVNLIDQRVLHPRPDYVSYYLSKSVLHVATQTLAQALAPRIRVNGIGPGPTLQAASQTPEEFAAEAAGTPLGHGSAVEDIVEAVLYLARARSVSGQMIAVDGGQHLAWAE
ncbi:SDR family oxidoreductase [Labrys sp. LIt4]|nr:SDR family oxidoreductase [Labrys sp. LIt4]